MSVLFHCEPDRIHEEHLHLLDCVGIHFQLISAHEICFFDKMVDKNVAGIGGFD